MLIQYTEITRTLQNLIRVLKRNNKKVLVFEMTRLDFFGCNWDYLRTAELKESDRVFLRRMFSERISIVD